MRLGILLTQLDSGELGKDAVAYVAVVLCLVSLWVGEKSQLQKLGVCQIVEGKQVGTRLLKGGTVLFEGIGVSSL